VSGKPMLKTFGAAPHCHMCLYSKALPGWQPGGRQAGSSFKLTPGPQGRWLLPR
jgi:hypothetical protein